jgi:hypothetical protein
VSGQVVPSSTGRYMNLIALIDEILVAQGQGNAPSETPMNSGERETLSR